MASTLPFIRFIPQPDSAEPDALLGFSLPFLPDMLTSRWLTGSNTQERLQEALRLQVRLINAFWRSGITAWDLRFVGTDELTILDQVASALDHAHQHQLVHRDVKPDNLLRHNDGRTMLSDFGIVQFEDDDLTVLTSDQQSSPHTPAYASPEQHLGQKVDYRSDIYSLGIIIYELLSGERPFKLAYEHAYSPISPMHTSRVKVHPALEAVVARALAKQPEHRYQSAGEMAAEFQKALAGR